MNPETLALVRYRVTLAEETLQLARLGLENGHLHGAVNRLYYACFYMVSALLLTEGLSSAKHSGVRSLFIQTWIKTNRLPLEISRFYVRLFKYRQKADYGDLVTFRPEEVQAWLQETQSFVNQIKEEIEKQV